MGGGRAILGPHAMPMGMYKNRVKIDECFSCEGGDTEQKYSK